MIPIPEETKHVDIVYIKLVFYDVTKCFRKYIVNLKLFFPNGDSARTMSVTCKTF